MKTIKELLQILLDHISLEDTYPDGMCILIIDMRNRKLISSKEYRILQKYINNNITEQAQQFKLQNQENNNLAGYWFDPYDKQPRIEWLQEQIKKL